MLTNEREKLSEILMKTAAALDIPDYVYEDATLKYEDIGSWLAAEDSELESYSPEIYPQGSFRLGTVVRPISERDEYDVDLVCRLELDKEQTTQKNLKQMVGDRLQKRDDLAKMLESSRRCWILGYPPEGLMPHFHMDVLPAIPNHERPPMGILITDTELTRWQKSNPKAYADWFFDRMKAIFLENRAVVAKSLEASVEEVPEWRVKTPLQIAIQILKCHRDIYFQNNLENKPVSIIITTLAALAYSNQANVYDALIDIVRNMPNNIEKRNGRWWVVNPVDPDENFADKWNEYPERCESFERWLKKVRDDFSSVSQQQTVYKAVPFLESALGQRVIATVATDLGLKLTANLPTVITPLAQVPALGDAQHCQPPTWPLQVRYKAEVTGSVHHRDTYKKLWDITNRSVPKEVRLKFKVRTNTPQPYEVKWQVVNTGEEAAAAEDLRGDFYESDETNTDVRWEKTAYKGTHWAEAFIIKEGVCVARSGRKMVRVR
jgi:hypothetical protein